MIASELSAESLESAALLLTCLVRANDSILDGVLMSSGIAIEIAQLSVKNCPKILLSCKNSLKVVLTLLTRQEGIVSFSKRQTFIEELNRISNDTKCTVWDSIVASELCQMIESDD